MTSRIHRGFHRIGVVLAVPVVLLSIMLAGHEAWLQWATVDPFAEFADAPSPPLRPAASHGRTTLSSVMRHRLLALAL